MRAVSGVSLVRCVSTRRLTSQLLKAFIGKVEPSNQTQIYCTCPLLSCSRQQSGGCSERGTSSETSSLGCWNGLALSQVWELPSNPGGFCEAFLDTGYLERDAQLVCMKYSLITDTSALSILRCLCFNAVCKTEKKCLVFVAKTNTVVGPSALYSGSMVKHSNVDTLVLAYRNTFI